MSKNQKSFTAFLKKRAPIYLGLLGLFFLFAYPVLMEKNLESHIPTDLSDDQQVMVDFILSYNGLNNSGMTIMNVLEDEISAKYVDEKIFDTEITLLRLEFQKLSNSDFSHEVTFLFMINEEILTYTWIVDMNSGEISSGNQEAKRILDIVNYYD
tara:strand:+ start:329 stop:793 length:465 start_codon:yes stop_codon:yes gene_type:complete